LSNVCIVLFLNTPIRRPAIKNVTAESGLLDVQPYIPGERVKLVGENSGRQGHKSDQSEIHTCNGLLMREKKAFCINYWPDCINFNSDFIFILANRAVSPD
jgi:hypothetical protein